MLWGAVAYLPIYRNVYWDYHARRVVLKNRFDRRSEAEKIEDAGKKKGQWGYKPRFEPTYSFSLK
jgi:hypothetical protein